MGSKNLKAIIARGGAFKIGTADPQKFAKTHKLAVRQINTNKFTGTMYRKFGTAANVNLCNEGNILPVNNFTVGRDDRAGEISGETSREAFGYKTSACQPCSILCGHKGVYAGEIRQAPEYETIGLLGSNLGIFDPLKISEWNEICADMGMDTISAGGTLAYVMEAAEKGLLPSDLRFGNPEGVSGMLEDIAWRRGLGDEAANGSRWLAQKYGGMEFANQVKGMEMAGYDPRGSWGQGLAYAVANRGACHLSAILFPLEVFFGYIDPYTTKPKARFVHFLEDLYSSVNSMQTCLFTGYAYIFEAPLVKYTPKFILGFAMQNLPGVAVQLIDISMFSKLLSLATGVRFSPGKFLAAGERIHILERYLNVREGISRKDDQLPKRFLTVGRLADAQGQVVPLDEMLDRYYSLRGYTPTGLPTLQTLRKAGITPAEDYGQLLASLDYKTLKPRKGWFKQVVVSTFFFILGRAFQSLSRRDETLRREVASWPEETTVLFKVLPKGPRLAFKKVKDGILKYLGSKVGEQDATLVINFKNLEAAFLMMTAQLGTARAYAEHRMSVRGDLPIALSNIRCLNVVERYLFPTFIAKNVVKRLPDIPARLRYPRRLWVYTMGILFGK
jgi:aldehyde:ferredoxin oxidoreductase